MSDLFIGEIRMFAGNFAPRGWAFCDGQLLGISQHAALFSILGTTYGGDGRTTFSLPELRGRSPIHAGSGPGLSSRRLGEKGGTESRSLTVSNLPSHSHPIKASTNDGEETNPEELYLAKAPDDLYAEASNTLMASDSTANVGGNQSVGLMSPFLVVHFIIRIFGTLPSKN